MKAYQSIRIFSLSTELLKYWGAKASIKASIVSLSSIRMGREFRMKLIFFIKEGFKYSG